MLKMSKSQPRIGVFDSGVGGKSVANAIQNALPDSIVTYVNDEKNVPYGTKTAAELHQLVLPILQDLATSSDVIVVACNTVSTTIISELREEISIPLIAMEPMVKPAAARTKRNVIAVCATPTTLGSERYGWLKQTYADGITVLEPDCGDWAQLIEQNAINDQKIRACIEPSLKQGADVIVLGCTHYHWIEADIQNIANEYGAAVLQPEVSVTLQLTQVLKQLA